MFLSGGGYLVGVGRPALSSQKSRATVENNALRAAIIRPEVYGNRTSEPYRLNLYSDRSAPLS